MPEPVKEEFFNKPEETTDPFAPKESKEPEVKEEKEPELTEDELEEIKNRRYRRLEAKYQAERESTIALNARLAAISEAQKFRQETGSDDIDQTVARIYGTNTPEAQEATRLLQEALKKGTEKAVNQALEKFEAKVQERDAELAKEEQTLDSFIETIEDEHNVDMTSNTASARKLRETYLDALERLSPKRNGEIVEYADPEATWEYVESKLAKTSSRAKELGSRSMTRSGSNSSDNSEQKVHEQWLKDQGII